MSLSAKQKALGLQMVTCTHHNCRKRHQVQKKDLADHYAKLDSQYDRAPSTGRAAMSKRDSGSYRNV